MKSVYPVHFEENIMETYKRGTRILLFDIETMANLAWVWEKYEQDVIAYEKEWYMLCFAYKWLGESKITVIGLDDFPHYTRGDSNEKRLIGCLWHLFNEADIIIAHNGNSFDIKKANAKFIQYEFAPPSHYKTIDTKLVARRYFKFNSNKLDDLAKILGIGRKIDVGRFEDIWLGCALGNKSAWKRMKTYNKKDVLLLEQVYLKLRAWMNPHPHVGLLSDLPDACPNCGKLALVRRGYAIRGGKRKYRKLQCKNCGAWTQHPIKKDELD